MYQKPTQILRELYWQRNHESVPNIPMTLQTVKPSLGPWTHIQRKWTHSVLQSSVEAQTTAPTSDVAIEIMDKENPWLWNKPRGHREQWTKDLLLGREAWSNQSMFSVPWPSSSWSCPEFCLMCFPFFYFLYWSFYCSYSVFASLFCIVLVMVEEAEDLAFIFWSPEHKWHLWPHWRRLCVTQRSRTVKSVL